MSEHIEIDGPDEAGGCDIAIVGMSGRFPGAADVAALWAIIRAGESGITRFTDAELRAAGVAEELLADPNYVRSGAVLEGIELFDAPFFGVGPKEAQILDPQHRLFLEHSWQALEDAGCDPARLDGTVGVFGGSAWSSYLSNNVAPSGVGAIMGELAVGLANDKDSLTTRVAHTLGLTGPTFGIQSYCSTSLVAVCAAATSLTAMECDLALAGGVAVAVPHRVGYLYQAGGIAPPDGECHAFDAAGLGAPLGSGVAVVALRRLEDALADGDRVYAVIRGWAVNNDGGRKVGFTAPGVQGQAEVIAEALSSADLGPAEIDYVEAHGTGTALGDAAELAALQQVFRGETCLIGSIKTNVGHLDRAAGVTGLIKAALSLRHQEIPPTRGLTTLNPQLKTGAASLEVVTELTPWPRRGDRARRAGVSAFGIGGTNAHVVLEEAPLRRHAPSGPAGRPQVLVWSARDVEAADAMTARLAEHLDEGRDPIADVAFTLQTGRRVFEHRRMLVAGDPVSAVEGLRGTGVRGRTDSGRERQVAFLIAGTGEQYPGMAADLYATEPAFRAVLDECRTILSAQLGFDPLVEMLAHRGGAAAGAGLGWLLGRETPAERTSGEATDHLQPATFAVEYALARLLVSWGVEPTVMAGYSLGEYVAACVSEVLTLPAALALVARRAQLITSLPAGTMAAVPLSVEEVRERIARSGAGAIDVAAINGATLTVVAGPPTDMHAFRTFLEGEATPCRPLSTSHAFHSRMLEPVRAELTAWVAANITVGRPTRPYISNVTGALITDAQLADPGYWAEHMCAPVRFDTALATVLAEPGVAVLEIGPGQSLGAMMRGRPDCPREQWPLIMPTLPAAADTTPGGTAVLEAMGRLWLAGVPIDWSAFQEYAHPVKVSLPGYPLRRSRYWIDAPTTAPSVKATAAQPPEGIRPGHVSLLEPTWTASPLATGTETDRVDLLAAEGPSSELAHIVAETLRTAGRDVRIRDTAEPDGPGTVVDLRPLDLDRTGDGRAAVAPLAAALDAWGQTGESTHVFVVTRGGQATSPVEVALPVMAAAGVLPVVANQEYLSLTARTVDLDPGATPAELAEALVGELGARPTDLVVAYRDGRRLVRGFTPTGSGAGAGTASDIRPGGTYLITGGLGDVGLRLAEHLARRGAGDLVLTSRHGAPTTPGDPRHEALARLRALGAGVHTPAVDVTDTVAMHALIAATLTEHGALHGVIHAAAHTGQDGFRVLRDTDTDPDAVAAHFAAKVTGAQVLAEVLGGLAEHDAPDFCVVFSSTSSVLGGLAFGSYAAANAALTAVARQQHSRPTRWVATAWDTWACTVSQLDGGVGAAMLAHSMSEEEALASFDRVLATSAGSVVVAAGGWADRLPTLTRAAPAVIPAGGQRFPRPDLAQPYSPPLTATERTLAALWSDVLGVEPVGTRDNFFDLSGNSLLALQMLALVKQRLGIAVPSVALFEAPTVHALAALLDTQAPSTSTPAPLRVAPAVVRAEPLAPARRTPERPAPALDLDDRIAVVGMAGRFPGAADVAAFWQNLRNGVESIRFFTPEELAEAGVDPALAGDPAYVPARPVLEDIAGFDAGFFGMSPRMAALTDPQQRLFLEVCWEALEQSGYAVPRGDRVGVFGGTNLSTYLLGMSAQLLADEDISTYEIIMGNEKDALTTQVSYLFDLQGPSVSVGTFCSTSLVATHLAVRSLRDGECELALAGGVSIRVPDKIGHRFAPGGMESPDGHVRTFDAQARGSMFGDGAAVVVLKRLADALRDGDHIWSVIRGSAMNNDGALKVGYTAPSVVGQARVISDAMADAGVQPRDVAYIEAHGTATELGDPIEVAALTRAFGPDAGTQYCPIGSVKTNIGHLDRAAGVTGLIKTSMALWDNVIPPSLHYTAPNPDIDFAHSPFYVNTALAPWSTRDGQRPIAGVNSLGMGGTNVHVVLEQAPVRPAGGARPGGRRYQAVPVSARTATALEQAGQRLAGHLADSPQTRLADVAYTLQIGRRTFEHRRVVVAEGTARAAQLLAGGEAYGRVDAASGRPVAFLLGGSGNTATVAQLYRREPAFRAALERVDELVRALPADVLPGAADLDLVDLLSTADLLSTGDPLATGDPAVAAAAAFALDYALARTLLDWGITPRLVAGSGPGHDVAAHLTGTLDLAAALTRAVGSHDAPQGLTAATLAELADPELVLIEIGAPIPDLVTSGVPTSGDLHVRLLPAAGEPGPDDKALTEALGRLWLLGVEVDWAAHHGRCGTTGADADLPGRIPLPTYPFQRSRYWLEAPAPAALTAAAPDNLFEAIAALPRLPEEQWLHLPVWRQSAPAASDGAPPASWLVFTGDGVADEAATALAGSGGTLDLVRPGERFGAVDGGWTVRPGVAADLVALLRTLQAAGRPLQRAVHLWTVRAGAPATHGLPTLVALAQAAAELGIGDWALDVVVSGTQEVLPGETSDPDAAMAAGPVLVVPLEYPGVATRLIDLPTGTPASLLPDLVAELRRAPLDRIVALRRGRRWLPGYESLAPDGAAGPLREGGVYLVTGGLGGIVLGVAERLAQEHRAKLVLLARNGIDGTGEAAQRRGAQVAHLRELGAEVEIVVGDVADPGDVRRAVDTALARFGALHGVFHAAGVPGMGLMQFKRAEEMQRVLAPKVAGTQALEQALRLGEPDEVPLDFLLLFSSITTATGGGPGQVDYCAANAYLDAWAATQAAAGRPVIAVDWGEWTWNAWEDGLAGYDSTLQEFFRANRLRFGIGFDEGWRALVRALAVGLPRVVVSTQDFQTVVQGSAQFTVDAVRAPAAPVGQRHPRPELTTMFQEPEGPVQTAVAQTWCEALRLEEIGVQDNFFELGGNSLLGVSIVTALRREFSLDELAPHILYEAPTVAALAAVIDAAGSGAPDPATSGENDASQVRAQLRRSGLETSAARRRAR